jgi:predicted transcriptional regulator
MEIFNKPKSLSSESISQEIPEKSFEKQLVFTGAMLESLREIRQKLEELDHKIEILEKNFESRVPEKILTEKKFQEEIQTSDDIISKIISEVKSATRPLIASQQQLTIIEQKRIEKILSILDENGKLSSSQLAEIMNLSRTRCNEYFKQMEELNLVEGIEIGKEKYYNIKS